MASDEYPAEWLTEDSEQPCQRRRVTHPELDVPLAGCAGQLLESMQTTGVDERDFAEVELDPVVCVEGAGHCGCQFVAGSHVQLPCRGYETGLFPLADRNAQQR